MAKEKFKDWRPQRKTVEELDHATRICGEYLEAGFSLTVRQLFYQMVGRGHIENSQASYRRLVSIATNAREAGSLDWDVIVDRTRMLTRIPSWRDPQDFLDLAIPQFNIDKWKTQPCRIEIWVEKEALSEIVGKPADRYFVPYFCCRGYVSETSMYEAAKRFDGFIEDGQSVKILYLGDHDPSGLDMDRDVAKRLNFFMTDPSRFEFKRLALHKDQIDQYGLPPNKIDENRRNNPNDTRVKAYVDQYGYDETWELDALDTDVVDDLITTEIEATIDVGKYEAAKALQLGYQEQLEKIEL